MKFRPVLKLFMLYAATIVSLVFYSSVVFASQTDGNIDGSYRYAWAEAGTWIDFGTAEGSVRVTDSALTGYGWSAELGWVSLNCSNDSSCDTVNYKVTNDAEGHLSGYAWSESAGWVNFAPTNGGVSVGSDGVFSGYAWSDQAGWISFNCNDAGSCGTQSYKVMTDWRPLSYRTAAQNLAEQTESQKSKSGSQVWWFGESASSQSLQSTETPTLEPRSSPQVKKETASVSDTLKAFVPGFLKDKTEPKVEPLPVEKTISKETPLSMSGKWSLLPTQNISNFVLGPLPKEIRSLAQKFPELDKTFKKLGIAKVTDLDKLKEGRFVLPGITSGAGLASGKAVAISKLSGEEKKIIPVDVVFAKSGDLIDHSIALTIDERGLPTQRIETLVGRPIDLAVKADKPVESVKGFLTVKNLERELGRTVSADSLLAAPIMAVLGMKGENNEKTSIEEKMVVSEFEYTDPDRDGIYTASLDAPKVHGEYEIITVMKYKDPSLGSRELRLTTVIDPEGYVYEQIGEKELRVPNAKISLLRKNASSGEFSLWKASDYSQVNPQKTDKSGTYSFLVPEGIYKLEVTAPGYYDWQGTEFTVMSGRGVHENISLKPKSWWRSLLGLY